MVVASWRWVLGPQRRGGQVGVQCGDDVGVGDRPGAEHDGLEQPEVDVTGFECGPDLGQPVAHLGGVVQIARGQPDTDPQGGRDLRGDRGPGVDGQIGAFTGIAQPLVVEVRDGHQPFGGGLRLGTRGIPHPRQQRRRHRRGLHRHRILEHTYDYATTHRRRTGPSYGPIAARCR